MKRELRSVGVVAPSVIAQLTRARTLDTLEDVLRARFDVLEIIVQDEYTHDVIVRGAGDAFLVFDTT